MLSFDPDGYSMRWYRNIVEFGMNAPNAVTGWWADMWENADWVRAAKNSFLIGIASTLLATGLGTLAALGLSRPEMPFRRIIMALLISPMIVPLIITATGLFFFYSSTGLAQTYPGIIMAHATLGIPLRHHHGHRHAGRLRLAARARGAVAGRGRGAPPSAV